jgi:CheY-like chemotaxis protein
MEGALEILLIEDSPEDVELTLRALRKAKVASRVEVVRDGAEGLDFIFCRGQYRERRLADLPRLILLDLKLPKVDGLEVLRQLKTHPTTISIPVVIHTSSSEQRDLSESYRLGVNSYLVKSVNVEGFTQAVQSLGRYWLQLNEIPPVENP